MNKIQKITTIASTVFFSIVFGHYAFAEDKRKTMEAGMDAHLSKPLNVPELMETIRKFCVGKQMCQ